MDKEMRSFRDEVSGILQSILSTMLSHKDSISVTYTFGSRTTVFRIDCHPADYGVLVGKNGRNIEGLRRVTMAMMIRFGYRGVIEIPAIEKQKFVLEKD